MKKSQEYLSTTRSNHRQTFPIDGFENDFMLELMLFEQVTNAKEISDSIKSGAFDVEVALMNPKTSIHGRYRSISDVQSDRIDGNEVHGNENVTFRNHIQRVAKNKHKRSVSKVWGWTRIYSDISRASVR